MLIKIGKCLNDTIQEYKSDLGTPSRLRLRIGGRPILCGVRTKRLAPERAKALLNLIRLITPLDGSGGYTRTMLSIVRDAQRRYNAELSKSLVFGPETILMASQFFLAILVISGHGVLVRKKD